MVDFIGPDFAKSIINIKGGVSKLNKYRVILPSRFVGGDAISMDVLCRSATLPGRAITSAPRRVNMKEVQMPTGYTVDPVDLLFTETNDHTVSYYFDAWMDQVVNPKTYEVAFKNDVVEDILIMSVDDAGIPSYICQLKNAWPKVKTRVELSDGAENAIKEIRVQIEYEDYEIKDSLGQSALLDTIRSARAGRLQVPTNTIRRITSGIL